MRSRYSFWDVGSSEKGDKDSFEEFENYYHSNKRKFKSITITDAVNLFQNWINDLSDRHFSVAITDPVTLKEYILSPRNKRIKNKESINYSTYQEDLKKFGFNLIENKTYNFNPKRPSHILFGDFTSINRNKKILYLAFSNFYYEDNLKKTLEKYWLYLNETQKVGGTIIDLRNNLGGNPFFANILCYLFTGADKNIGGVQDKPLGTIKFRTDVNPKAPKSPDQEIKIKSSLLNISQFSDLAKLTSLKNLYKTHNTPLVILIDGNTASTAEYFSSALRQRNKVTLVGKNTLGQFSPPRALNPQTYEGGQFELYGGGMKIKVIIANGVMEYKKCEIEGEGIFPDIYVDGNDAQIKKALEIINKG